MGLSGLSLSLFLLTGNHGLSPSPSCERSDPDFPSWGLAAMASGGLYVVWCGRGGRDSWDRCEEGSVMGGVASGMSALRGLSRAGAARRGEPFTGAETLIRSRAWGWFRLFAASPRALPAERTSLPSGRGVRGGGSHTIQPGRSGLLGGFPHGTTQTRQAVSQKSDRRNGLQQGLTADPRERIPTVGFFYTPSEASLPALVWLSAVSALSWNPVSGLRVSENFTLDKSINKCSH